MRSARKRPLIALGALLALNAAVYLAFTLPRTLQQRNLDLRLRLAQDEVSRERQRLDGMKKRLEVARSNARDTTDFYQRYVGAPGSSLVPVLAELEELARKRGLQVGNQRFEMEPVKGAPLDRFAVEMPVRGTYHELVGFVQDLERSKQFITLDEISARGEDGGEAQLKLVLSCYFRSVPGRQGT